jgi:hypothetical protein
MIKQHADMEALDELIKADPSVRDLMPTKFKNEFLGKPITITIFPENQQVADAIQHLGGAGDDGLTVFVNECLHTIDQDATKSWNEKQLTDAIDELEQPF